MESNQCFKFGVYVRVQLSYAIITYVKSYLLIEEKSQHINEFSFGYMFNTTLYTNTVFKEQVKACLKNTFGTDTNKHIHKTLQKKTRVLELVVFYDLGNINPMKMFKVLSCVIYTIIDR